MRIALDGVPVLEDSGAGWAFPVGTAPHTRALEFPTDVAHQLYDRATDEGSVLDLDLRDVGRGVERVERLTILRVQAGRDRYHRRLIVADRRWKWSYGLYVKSFNFRRRTGARRRLPNVPIAIDRIQDDVAYTPWSLKDELTAWTPQEVLTDVLDAVAGDGGWRVEDDEVWEGLQAVEELELVGSHGTALGRALAYFGLALQVYVDTDGTVVLMRRVSGKDRELVGLPRQGQSRTAGQRGGVNPPEPELAGEPGYALLDRRRERPARVVIHFDRLLEVRVDYTEAADGTSAGRHFERGAPPPVSDWIVQIPEDIEIDGRPVPLGTYVPGTRYLEWLEGKTLGGLPDLTTEIIQAAALSPALAMYADPALDLTGIWAKRVSAILSSYRLLFQVKEPWRSRVREWRAYRAALLEIETGAQGPPAVFADHALWSEWAWLGAETIAGPIESQQPVRNVYANAAAGPGNVVGTPIEDLTRAPCELTVQDSDQGVFRLDYRVDYTGLTSRVLPSALTVDSLPTDDPIRENRWLAYGNMTPTHELSAVLTAVLGAPNDERRHHRVTIEADDPRLRDVLAPLGGVGQALGPEIHVRISPARSVARFGWDDSRSDQVRQALAPGRGVDLQDALGDPINEEEVSEVALAAAKRIYLAYVDHMHGTYTTGFRAGVRPVGHADVRIDEAGGFVTSVEWGLELPPIEEDALLSPGINRLVRRMVDP